MRIIIISLTLITFLNCKGSPLSVKEPPDYGLGWNFIFWAVIVPEQKRKEQCSQPNAISYNIGNVYCIYNKTSQGLIYDANTMFFITTDTISPGQSLFCQCGTTFNANSWYRGNKVEDNPPNGVSTSFIYASSPNTSAKVNIPLVYKTNYNESDNLYCITVCPANSNNLQYQFLKIRSSQ